MKVALKWTVFLLGLGLVGWFVYRAGPVEIYHTLLRSGGWMPVVLLPFFFVYLLDTLGWHQSFAGEPPVRPSYGVLFRVRWAAEAVNNVVPSAHLGGEVLKVYLLHKRGFSRMAASVSVVTSKTSQVLAHVVFIGLGALAGAGQLPADAGARTGMMAVAAAAGVVVVVIFLLQRRGLFNSLYAVLALFRIRFESLRARERDLRELDRRIFAFYRSDGRRFFRTTAAYLAGWLMDSVEVYLSCVLLGVPINWETAIAIESFISVSKAVGIFVPGALGVQESGVMLLFGIFGLPAPVAMAYAIIRRGREALGVLVGGALLYSERRRFGQGLAPGTNDSPAAPAAQSDAAVPGR